MFRVVAEQIGEVFKLCRDRVEYLLTPVRGVLPKEEKDMSEILQRLFEAFNTPKDPTLLLKRSSMKRGTEATVVLTMSHGENIDWAKVSLSHAQGATAMKGFFAEAKKYL
jgi:hypothetical protein